MVKLFIGILNHFSCSSHLGPWLVSNLFALILSLLGIVVELFTYLLEFAAIIVRAASSLCSHIFVAVEKGGVLYCAATLFIWKMFCLWFRMIIIQSQNFCVDNYSTMYTKISKVCTPFSSFCPSKYQNNYLRALFLYKSHPENCLCDFPHCLHT